MKMSDFLKGISNIFFILCITFLSLLLTILINSNFFLKINKTLFKLIVSVSVFQENESRREQVSIQQSFNIASGSSRFRAG